MADLIKNYDFGISRAFETEKLDALLEEASAKGGRPNKWTKKKSFAPSGLGYGSGTCPRYWYYAFHGANFNYENTARQRANMDAGTAAGDRIAKLFDAAGILNAAEVEVKHDDPPIYGFMDLAVTWQGEEMIGEVKTTNEASFNYRMGQMAAPGYQLIQLLIYMKVFNKEKGFFLVENKNTHEILILPVKMTEENEKFIDGVFEWMRMVKKNSDEDKLPTRPFTPKSKECKSCPVWDTCWAGFVKTTKARGEGSDPAPGVVTLPPLEVPR